MPTHGAIARGIVIKEFNEEVLYATDQVVKVGREELDLLKERAKNNKRHIMRICAHPNTEDTLHEMFIAIQQGAYIRPHRHLNKSESFHVIEGTVDVVLFNDNGSVTQINRVADLASGGTFYHRVSDPFYHTLLVRSEYLVFHEITNGPFKQEHTEYAPWAPTERDVARVRAYYSELSKSVDRFVSFGEIPA